MILEELAFVLRAVKYGERDLIVDLFVEGHGKISAIAKSAKTSKKRFPGGLEPFSKMKVRVKIKQNRALAFLEESDIQNGNVDIRGSFDKITVAAYATELVSVFVQPDEPSDEIFDTFDAFLKDVAKQEDERLPKLLLNFETDIANCTGFSPALYACFKCGEGVEGFIKYRISRGGEGLICSECTEGEHYGIVEKSTMQVFWHLYQEALQEYAHVAQARRIIWASLGPVVDRELKTRAQVEALWIN